MTDGELIAAAHRGDADAWRTLYERWLPWVWRCAYAQVGNLHAAEDVASEAMTAWVRRLTESGGDAPQIAAWLRTVVRNKAADHHRRLCRTRRAMEEATTIAQQNAVEADPTQPARDDETRQQVNRAIEGLPENYRLALEWKYSDSLSVAQIAERLGVTEKSAEAILYRARKEFRQRYELIEAQEEHGSATVSPGWSSFQGSPETQP